MPFKSNRKTVEAPKAKETFFTCKFCGETKPLNDLIVLRQYYPPLSACKACSIKSKIEEPPVPVE